MAGKWTNEDKREIANVFGIMAIIQKSFGVEVEIIPTLQAWEFVLSDYTGEQVTNAMQAWIKESNSMPTPADLIKIITPEKKKITQSEFIHAQQQHAKEGYPMFGYWGTMIDKYHAQDDKLREEPLKIADSIKVLLPAKKKLN